jgi:hypothetical protein
MEERVTVIFKNSTSHSFARVQWGEAGCAFAINDHCAFYIVKVLSKFHLSRQNPSKKVAQKRIPANRNRFRPQD